jgi:hypothetical protein
MVACLRSLDERWRYEKIRCGVSVRRAVGKLPPEHTRPRPQHSFRGNTPEESTELAGTGPNCYSIAGSILQGAGFPHANAP